METEMETETGKMRLVERLSELDEKLLNSMFVISIYQCLNI